MNKLLTSILMAFLVLFLFLGIKAAEAKENPNRLNEIRAAHAAIKHQNGKTPSFFLEAKLSLLKIEAIAAK